MCGDHGGSTQASKDKVARARVADLAGLPEVKPDDLPKIITEFIAWNVRDYAELRADLENLRVLGSVVEHTRAYDDILRRLDQIQRNVVQMSNAAAALGLRYDPPKVEAPIPQLLEVLAHTQQILEEQDEVVGICPRCKQDLPQPTRADELDEPEPDPTQDQEPEVFLAEVIDFPAPQEDDPKGQ